jgi:hypothetical protein
MSTLASQRKSGQKFGSVNGRDWVAYCRSLHRAASVRERRLNEALIGQFATFGSPQGTTG